MPRSRPVWGAWIEIALWPGRMAGRSRSRPVWGAWIEIQTFDIDKKLRDCRAPYGARGLKYVKDFLRVINIQVAPRMGRVD